MVKLTYRYILVVLGTLFVFANFVACGSQLYQVSLKGDTALQEDFNRKILARNFMEFTLLQVGLQRPFPLNLARNSARACASS